MSAVNMVELAVYRVRSWQDCEAIKPSQIFVNPSFVQSVRALSKDLCLVVVMENSGNEFDIWTVEGKASAIARKIMGEDRQKAIFDLFGPKKEE